MERLPKDQITQRRKAGNTAQEQLGSLIRLRPALSSMIGDLVSPKLSRPKQICAIGANVMRLLTVATAELDQLRFAHVGVKWLTDLTFANHAKPQG